MSKEIQRGVLVPNPYHDATLFIAGEASKRTGIPLGALVRLEGGRPTFGEAARGFDSSVRLGLDRCVKALVMPGEEFPEDLFEATCQTIAAKAGNAPPNGRPNHTEIPPGDYVVFPRNGHITDPEPEPNAPHDTLIAKLEKRFPECFHWELRPWRALKEGEKIPAELIDLVRVSQTDGSLLIPVAFETALCHGNGRGTNGYPDTGNVTITGQLMKKLRADHGLSCNQVIFEAGK